MVRQNYQEGTYEFQEPTLRRQSTVRRENLSGESQGVREEFQPEEPEADAGIHKGFFGPFKVISFMVITLNREFNYMCPKEESFPIPQKKIEFMRSTHTDLKLHKKNELMTIGMSTETEVCQIRGKASQDLR